MDANWRIFAGARKALLLQEPGVPAVTGFPSDLGEKAVEVMVFDAARLDEPVHEMIVYSVFGRSRIGFQVFSDNAASPDVKWKGTFSGCR